MYCRGELKPVSGILKRPPVEPELALPVIFKSYDYMICIKIKKMIFIARYVEGLGVFKDSETNFMDF